GLWVVSMLFAVGAVGCCKWLLGPHWLTWGCCILVGLVGHGALFVTFSQFNDSRLSAIRRLADLARSGPTSATLRGLVTALDGALTYLGILVLVAGASYWMGQRTATLGGGPWGLAMGLLGVMGCAPYVLAIGIMGSLADIARGMLALTQAERADAQTRARLLDSVGSTTKGFSRLTVTAATALVSMVYIALFRLSVGRGSAPSAAFSYELMGGAAGALVVFAFCSIVLRRILHAARDLIQEARALLVRRREDTVQGLRSGELACLELVSRSALRGMLTPATVGLGLPVLVAVGLRLAAGEDRLASSAEGIVAFLGVAAFTSALGSLLFTQAGSAWDNAKKYIETGAHGGRYILDSPPPNRLANPGRRSVALALSGDPAPDNNREGPPKRSNLRARTDFELNDAVDREDPDRVLEVDNPTYLAAVIGDTIGDPLKGAVGPATQALVVMMASLAQVFFPFFR
ncbi:MAG: sodium/proton-translocating pyrophosphatase, partial [Myxococcota bacterium]